MTTNLLPEENVVALPELADAKAFLQTTVLVRLREEPGSVHERLACRF